jgi:hypothetical protein
MGTSRICGLLKSTQSQGHLTNRGDEDTGLNPRILLALKLPIVVIVGSIAAIIWLRGWSLAMTHVGFGVLTSSWFIALTDLPHNPTHASDLFFSWFDSVYAGVDGLVISLGVACALRVPPFLAWLGFCMAAIGCAGSIATSHPELPMFMIRFPTLHAFLFSSALGFYAGSLCALRSRVSNNGSSNRGPALARAKEDVDDQNRAHAKKGEPPAWR